jgi:hypothetical protein
VGREQLAILYADMANEGHLGFNLPAFLKLPRDLDKKRLEAAIGTLIQRHEVLRTSFRDLDAEQPAMVIHPFTGFVLEEAHIPDLAGKDAFIRPFSPREPVLFRATLLVAGGSEHVLFFDIYHALADGRTISLLNAELYRLYHGQPLEPVTAQQKDFAWRQFTRPDQAARDYWQGLYRDGLPKLDLPADFARPKTHTGRGGMYEFALSDELVAAVKALARRESVTNYHVALCAWSILAAAYTGSRDVVIAVSMDSREGHLNTAGMLASLLPLRLDADRNRSLGGLLGETRRISNEALRHRAYILNDLLMDLRLPASMDRSPLSELMFSYMNFEFGSGEHGLFETYRFEKGASKTDLSIFGSDTGDRIGFALEYYADLFSHANIVRMAEDFVAVLTLMTTGRSEDPVPFAPSLSAPTHAQSRETGAALTSGIAALGRTKGVSTQSVLLAAFAALLSRITLRQSLTIDVAGTGPVAFSIDDDMEFDALLAWTEARLRRAGADDPPAPSGEDAMTLGFAYPATEDAPMRGYGLLCTVREQDDGLVLRFEHDPRVLADDMARNWLAYFERFLIGITEGMGS